jgi:hypothetical protein
MTNVFELYINKEVVTEEDFLKFYSALSGYVGGFKKLRFHVLLRDKHVRYFVQSDRDYRDKIFFDEVRQEIEPIYRALKKICCS